LLLSLVLVVAASADAKEPSARASSSAKASRATHAATPRPRSKARPTSSKQSRPSAKRGSTEAAAKPPAEPAAPSDSDVKDEPAAAPGEPAREAKAEPGGVKTFTFKAQEIEGRLKAPQILYFLRRVRAEFDAQALGHRSFLLELSDTRRQSVLR
jgi:hypothetical protein